MSKEKSNIDIDGDLTATYVKSASGYMGLGGTSGNPSNIEFVIGSSSVRWTVGRNQDPESTGNAGSNLVIGRWADNGTTYISDVIKIFRNTAQIIVGGQLLSTRDNDVTTGGGQISLAGAVGNRIDFHTTGVAAPTFTTRSAGTKIVFYPQVGASSVDYAIGMEGNTLWQSTPTTTSLFKWYFGTTNSITFDSKGVDLATGSGFKWGVFNTGIFSDANTIYFLDATGAGSRVIPAYVGEPTLGPHAATKTYTDAQAEARANAYYNYTFTNPLNFSVSISTSGNLTVSGYGIINGAGIQYPGFTFGAVGGNRIAMKWGSNNIMGGVDNVNNMVLGTTSARVWKTGITTTKGGLDKILRLRSVEYTPKEIDGTTKSHERRHGLIADEVRRVLPGAVPGVPGKVGTAEEAVNYLEIVPVLVAAIQELSEEIKSLKTQMRGIQVT
jgi:Chaperone of endosialidase